MQRKIFAAILALASSLCAQTSGNVTTPSNAPLFTPASYALDLHLNGQSSVGNLTVETFNLTHNFGVEAAEMLDPTLNMQSYYGGAAYTPDLSALFKKTTLAANPPTISFAADGGETMNVGATPSTKASFLLRAIFALNLGGGIATPISVGYAYAPGFGASHNALVISAGLSKTFNLP